MVLEGDAKFLVEDDILPLRDLQYKS
jgi:hypothetical protein